MNLSIALAKVELSDLTQIEELFAVCGWDWFGLQQDAQKAFDGSFFNVTAMIDRRLVGFGRVISDGAVYGLIVDLMTHPDFRRQGVGHKLTEFILQKCTDRSLKVIQLLASTLGRSVYLQSGFTQCPDHSPGMIKFLSATAVAR